MTLTCTPPLTPRDHLSNLVPTLSLPWHISAQVKELAAEGLREAVPGLVAAGVQRHVPPMLDEVGGGEGRLGTVAMSDGVGQPCSAMRRPCSARWG